MTKNKRKVLVALSGGVDSSVSAWLLKKEGYEVTGVFMRLGIDSEDSERSVRALCRRLKLKFFPIDLSHKFDKEIISYFLDSYERGDTPNPCIRCNKLIKFGELFKLAKYLGIDYLATGHYVFSKIIKNDISTSAYKLFKGLDETKDQSYFLYNLKQEQLARLVFPLGELTKNEVRQVAQRENLPYLTKESQDICFLAKEGKMLAHTDFLKSRLKMKSGLIKEILPISNDSEQKKEIVKIYGENFKCSVKIVGQHSGLPLYTIGQRKGVEIGGTGPYYVTGMDYEKNILYVVKDLNNATLFKDEFFVTNVNWIGGMVPNFPLECEALIRYRHKPVPCSVYARFSDSKSKDVQELRVLLKTAERAVTVGQSVVFYDNSEVLGGGIIKL